MSFRRPTIAEPRVELTSMIDVVLLLLIFFMISTIFVEKPGLKIDLPETSSQQLLNATKEVQVYLTEDGSIYLQQHLVSLKSLHDQLTSYGSRTKEMTFLLMADKAVLHGRVIQLMDIAKKAGFAKLAIATDQKNLSSETSNGVSQ